MFYIFLKEVNQEGATESRIQWIATYDDNSRVVTCLATNPRNPKFKLQNETAIIVYRKFLLHRKRSFVCKKTLLRFTLMFRLKTFNSAGH